MHALELIDVSVTIHGQRLLRNIQLTLEPGIVCALIGGNGSGKSTLLKAISGEWPIRGEVKLFGKPLNFWALPQQAQRVAVLPQFSRLNFAFSVVDVVAMGRLPHHSGNEIDREVISQVLESLNIKHLRERNYLELSGGEKQRVQLARVLSQVWRAEDSEQRLLLLDEPTTSLDLGHQQVLMRLIKKLAANGICIVLVMHDLNLVSRNADKIVALKEGAAIAQGDCEHILTESLINELFAAKVELHSNQKYNRKYFYY